jgi:hypothetical protein
MESESNEPLLRRNHVYDQPIVDESVGFYLTPVAGNPLEYESVNSGYISFKGPNEASPHYHYLDPILQATVAYEKDADGPSYCIPVSGSNSTYAPVLRAYAQPAPTKSDVYYTAPKESSEYDQPLNSSPYYLTPVPQSQAPHPYSQPNKSRSKPVSMTVTPSQHYLEPSALQAQQYDSINGGFSFNFDDNELDA